MSPTFDLSDPTIWEDGFPHGLFAQIRSEAPIFLHEVTPHVREYVNRPFWICATHELVRRIHRDTDSFTATDGPLIQSIDTFSSQPSIIVMDPPELTSRRNVLSRAFTPRAVAKLEAAIKDRAARYLDELLEAGEGDWVADVAHRLPMNVIGDIVGIPEEDREQVFSWVDAVLHEPGNDAPFVETYQYAAELTRRKREHPTDDIWSALCNTSYTERDGSTFQFEENELEVFFFILSLAGSDTTRTSLTVGLQAFIDHPDQLLRYREDPDLRTNAVEEAIRWASPLTYWVRGARRDLEMGGAHIRQGDRVVSVLASANHDEDIFEDPFEFDISRAPNPHVGFGGGGAHHCLGAMLARVEMRVAFDEVLLRTKDIHLGPAVTTHPSLFHNMAVHHSLPITLEAN
jgi:cytochrome P450